jgi:hypothetical protein
MNFVENLVDKDKPWGYVKFIHKDGSVHEFYSCINKLSGDRLSALDKNPPCINESLKWVKSVFRDIFKKSEGILDFKGNILEKQTK